MRGLTKSNLFMGTIFFRKCWFVTDSKTSDLVILKVSRAKSKGPWKRRNIKEAVR